VRVNDVMVTAAQKIIKKITRAFVMFYTLN